MTPNAEPGRRAGEHEGGDRRHHDPQEALVRQVAQPRFAKRCFEHFILRWGMNTALEPQKEEKPPAPQQFFSLSQPFEPRRQEAEEKSYVDTDADDDEGSVPLPSAPLLMRHQFADQNIHLPRMPLIGNLIDYHDDDDERKLALDLSLDLDRCLTPLGPHGGDAELIFSYCPLPAAECLRLTGILELTHSPLPVTHIRLRATPPAHARTSDFSSTPPSTLHPVSSPTLHAHLTPHPHTLTSPRPVDDATVRPRARPIPHSSAVPRSWLRKLRKGGGGGGGGGPGAHMIIDGENVVMDAPLLSRTDVMKVRRRPSLRQFLSAHACIPVSTFCPPLLRPAPPQF
ncbi:hypothetical protein HETIRDRAFT_453807 [Heterobasidion irregulare TC 32-1]|uniref:Uncharacterized protein n=1 Tax=Heterobasidion irregulare (strain TC 32-1) TaxID=747525 RepID=W4K2U8_HETIT|nr:uncharacterized protein HETIRDRAFT_453807 [Heterobasidion irregulare TC 32-1]ETW79381.1 hypothetical protein HETIRDRAFT_453807 [Heterobasidion irregulare TC 32-1]